MKIVAPLSNIENYEPLVNAGADEFFCGFIPYEWLKEFNNSMPLNRREYLYKANICTLSSMKILKRMIDTYKVPVKITFNSHYYTQNQYELLEKIISRLIAIGFDTFIIADISLILYLRKNNINCNIHLSGETSEVNRMSIKFFNQFNISRYVFHRKNSIEDMKACIASNNRVDTEFEAFILNELCPYTGAFCNSIHCDELSHACKIPYKMSKLNELPTKFKMVERVCEIRNKISGNQSIEISESNMNSLGGTGCGLCKIYELKEVGVTHLKVVGRGKELHHLVNDIGSIKQIINISNHERDKESFSQRIRKQYFNNKCPDFCYYL